MSDRMLQISGRILQSKFWFHGTFVENRFHKLWSYIFKRSFFHSFEVEILSFQFSNFKTSTEDTRTKLVNFTKLFEINRGRNCPTVWNFAKFAFTKPFFREISSLVTSLLSTLLSRNFCQTCVRLRVNSRNFHNVCAIFYFDFSHFVTKFSWNQFNSVKITARV